ncbi:MAG: DUF448 domain-containing protein [Candidatus Sericytochromatia bacterium]|nr:DUF448 domain-containing protein [Candidatus Tanganyikabacteria bacterium]
MACRAWSHGPDMIRIARHADGSWDLASRGGHGHYVHPAPSCLAWAHAPKSLPRLMGASAAERIRAALPSG